MKYIVLTLLLTLCACKSPTALEIEPKLEATVTIVQPIRGGKVYFEITNTGDIHIDEWEVWFNVYTDGSFYRYDKTGQDLYIDQTILVSFWVDNLVSVNVDEIVLK